MPDWSDPPCDAMAMLDSEDFARYRQPPGTSGSLLAKGLDHSWISGIQFFADKGEAATRYYDVPHGTRVYVLQNEAGAACWPFTEDKGRALLEAMRG